MWSANRLWPTTFWAAASAFILVVADCILAGCGNGSLIVAFRASVCSLFVAAIAFVATPHVFTKRGPATQFVVSLLIIAPLAVSSGFHLATTATITKLIDYRFRQVIPTAVLFFLYGGYFLLLTRICPTQNHNPWRRLLCIIVSLASAIALFAAASYFKKLHYSLSLATLFFSWLNLQNAARTALQVLPMQMARLGVGMFLGIGFTMFFVPVSIEDTFAASDQGIVVRDLTTLGRAHTMDELVKKATPPRHPKQKPVVPADKLPHLPQKSVVLISIDALRPDHLGVNDYGRNVSPNIDALLKKSVMFDRAYCSAPTSSFSIPSIHAGMPMEERLKSSAPLPPFLATHLSEMGYTTIGLYPPKVFSVGPALMKKIEESQFGFQHTELLAMDAQKDVQTALEHLGKHQATGPIFMWVHFYDPHLPYSCHDAPFGKTQVDCYDAEIAYLDTHIKSFLDEVETVLSNPIIAFTADHGEAFGEHGRYYHSTDLYNEQIRIPLAFRIPGVSPTRIDTPVSNCSIFDTILSLVQPPSNEKENRLENDLRPHIFSAGQAKPVLASIGPKRAIIFGEHKLICEKWPTGACALFDMKNDASELKNLAAKQIPKTMEMLGLLKERSDAELARLQETAPAAIILGRLKRPGARKGLIALANTPSSPHAIEATKLLALFRSSDTAAALEALSESNVPRVAAWANVGLALLEKTFNAESLYPTLRENSDLGHWSAIVLGKNGDRRSLTPLLKLLNHSEPQVRALAALALGDLGNSRAVPSLISLLEIKQTRWAAIEALGALEDKRALHILRKLKQNEPDISNLPRYEKAIERIQSN